jgi:hypothetical protein
MIYSQGIAYFRYDSCIENLARFYFIKLVDWESVIMYSQRVVFFVMHWIVVLLQHGVNCKLVIVMCFTSLDRDHGKLWKLLTVILLFHCVSIMEASCMFYLIASVVMKLWFCIMVSFQFLLVNIMKRA